MQKKNKLGGTYWRKVNECSTGFHVTSQVFVGSLGAPTALCGFGSLGARSVLIWYSCVAWGPAAVKDVVWDRAVRRLVGVCSRFAWVLYLSSDLCLLPLPDLHFSYACGWPHTPLSQTPTCGLNCLLWLWTCLGITDLSSSLDSCFWLLPLELLCSSFLGTAGLYCALADEASACLDTWLPFPYGTASPCSSLLVALDLLEPWAKQRGTWPLGSAKPFPCHTVCTQGPDSIPKSLTKQIISFITMQVWQWLQKGQLAPFHS